jgi:hypothetical protein
LTHAVDLSTVVLSNGLSPFLIQYPSTINRIPHPESKPMLKPQTRSQSGSALESINLSGANEQFRWHFSWHGECGGNAVKVGKKMGPIG